MKAKKCIKAKQFQFARENEMPIIMLCRHDKTRGHLSLLGAVKSI